MSARLLLATGWVAIIVAVIMFGCLCYTGSLS